MQNLRKLIALAAVGILAAVRTLMNSSKVMAQGPPGGMAVNIVNPLPVPVTGSTTVSGSVAATQSAWNVSVSGTPSVSVASLPAVQLSGTPTVNVATPSGMPLPTVNQGDKGRTAYQSSVNVACSNAECIGGFPAVAGGHRLVIEHVSGIVFNATAPVYGLLFNESFPFTNFFPVPVEAQGTAVFDQAVLAYWDAGGQAPSVTIFAGSLGQTNATLSLSGYLVDCTVAPCAPIGH